MFKELGFTKTALSKETARRAAVKALLRSDKSARRMYRIMTSEKLMLPDAPAMAPQAAIMLKRLEKDMIKNRDRAELWSTYKQNDFNKQLNTYFPGKN